MTKYIPLWQRYQYDNINEKVLDRPKQRSHDQNVRQEEFFLVQKFNLSSNISVEKHYCVDYRSKSKHDYKS